ncbi:DUF4190 domain-containing protein [Pseudarthrobacter sp. S9]|uniref:DUF4190 domain-containing protein n=1 Tax=Pseudarthrobacter sp. S9 TaxID=3418421 RepID=UPI003CFBC8B9
MTDQPTPGNDEEPKGELPPSHVPPHGSEAPAPPVPQAPPHVQEPDYSQYGQKHDQGQQYGQGAPDFGQPAGTYGAPYGTTPYGTAPGAPGQQYGAPGQQYPQPGSPYNAYGQPAYYGVPAEPNGLSIASMCCGIAVFVGLGFFLLPQVAAVILGHLALKREPSGRGMAIAGLAMGYVGIALTAVVILIVLLALGSAPYRGYGV